MRAAIYPIALFATIGALFATGCSNQCKQLRADFDAAIQKSPFVEASDTLPIHVGLTMKTSLVNQVLDIAAQNMITQALNLTDTLNLAGGKSISIKTQGKLINVELRGDSACESCLRLDAKLDGKLAIKIPMLPIQRVPLKGTATFVAPLEFEREGTGAAVVIDTEQMVKIGKSHIDAEFAQLPPTWSKLLQGPLSDKLLASIAQKTGRVKLFTVSASDLGIEGLEVLPAKLITDPKTKTIFAGFATNLAAPDAQIQPISTLRGGQNFSIAMHPAMVAPAVEASMRAGKIGRRYTEGGKAKQDGPVHVTVNKMDPGEASKNGVPFDFGMRLWNLPEDGKCYWVDARALGNIAINNNNVDVTIGSVELGESSLPGIVLAIAEWQSSEVFSETRRVLKTSLSKENIAIPGGLAKMNNTTLRIQDGAIQLGGRLSVVAK